MKVKVTQLCPTLWDSMDCIVHGILQARILEWVVVPFSKGSSQSRDQSRVSCIVGGFFTSWATREARFKGSWHKKSAWIMFYCWTGQLGRKKRLTMTKAEGFSVNHRKFSLFLYQLRWQLHLWSRGSTRRLETICSTHVLKQCSGLMYLLFPAAFRGCLSGSSKLFLSW